MFNEAYLTNSFEIWWDEVSSHHPPSETEAIFLSPIMLKCEKYC